MMLTLARDPRLAPEADLGNPIPIFILRVRVSRIDFPDTVRNLHKLDSFPKYLVLCSIWVFGNLDPTLGVATGGHSNLSFIWELRVST